MKQERIDALKHILEESGCIAWEITDTAEEGWEFYLIGRKLDQHRVRHVNHVSVRVFAKAQEAGKVGTASGEIAPMADDGEMHRAVSDLMAAAPYALNPVWKLNLPKPAPEAGTSPDPDVEAIASDFLRTIRDLPEDSRAGVNSSEVFVTRVTKRFLNSEGVDVSDTYPVSMAEVIINARDETHEIELYRMLDSGTCDAEKVRTQLTDAMRYGKDKLVAQPTPYVQTMDLVLSTDAALEVYNWYIAHLNTAYKYQGYSDWEIGKPVAEDADGDHVTITARRQLPNSSANCRFDNEGAWKQDLVLMSGNVPCAFWGPRQFAQYLGLEDTFNATNFEVTGGTSGPEALRTGEYLEVVEFSSFQVDDVSGDLAGEIRLGYLHRGGETVIVSGGSVSGNMSDAVRRIRFSKESAQYDSMLIPAVTRIGGISVTGA